MISSEKQPICYSLTEDVLLFLGRALLYEGELILCVINNFRITPKWLLTHPMLVCC